jgi:DNA-binding beta-propeller fold protein YncE
VQPGVFVALIAAALIIISALLISVCLQSKNKWGGKRKPSIFPIALLLILVATMSGCAKQSGVDYAPFNHATRAQYENDVYRVYVDDDNIDDTFLAVENKITGEIHNLARDPFEGMYRIENAVYGSGDKVYYIKSGIDNSSLRSGLDRMYVMEIDLNDFSERVIFEKDINTTRDSFLGIFANSNKISDFPSMPGALFVDGERIFIVANDVWQIDRATHSVSLLPIPTNRSFAYDAPHIFYIDGRSAVMKYDTRSGQTNAVADVVTTCFYLTDTELFFVNRLDGSGLYTLNPATNESKKLADGEIQYFTCDSQYIYFQCKNDYSQYRMDKDGANRVEVE